MKIHFEIEYKTQWGQNLYVTGNCPELGDWDIKKAQRMEYGSHGNWKLDLALKKPSRDLSYKYFLKEDHGNTLFFEFGDERMIFLENCKQESLFLVDAWRSQRDDSNAFYASAFTKNLMRRKRMSKKQDHLKQNNHVFRLYGPQIDPDHVFCILGDHPQLASWNQKQPILMESYHYPVWEVQINIEDTPQNITYKYGIYDTKKNKLLFFESGANRFIRHDGNFTDNLLHIQTDNKFNFPRGNWKGSGVSIPVFSLRSKKSAGVGEFADIRILIDWARKTGLKLVQILPINDTIAKHQLSDSYPYAAISVFALHPIYMRIEDMGDLKNEKKMKQYLADAKILNKKPEVDYEAVMKLKSQFFKDLYDQDRNDFLSDKNYLKFFKENADWLVPYAAFSCLRDRYQTPEFGLWPQYSVYRKDEIEKFVEPSTKHYDDIAVHYFIQFHLYRQMKTVAEYARNNGVVLKGDIPIGIYRNSSDAWVNPELYNMDRQAGAPPDAFALTGQNWRFPTYNWERMRKDNYAWWRKRLGNMQKYFDAYRIDHILGFFRIWEIPINSVEGLMGQFNPAIPMTEKEINQHGLLFDGNRMCRPYIREYMIDEIFGEKRDAVKEQYFNKNQSDFYEFKPEYDTQQKIAASFSVTAEKDHQGYDTQEQLMRGLFSLVCNVLFLENDEITTKAYHPRIALHSTYAYRELDGDTKRVLNEVYNHYFFERQEQFWRDQAMAKLPSIVESTDMLVCGEDLGMVPDCVPGVMQELNILSLEIQRMPKQRNLEFNQPSDAPYLSVVTTSSHDMSTIRGWWEENREVTQLFYNQVLQHSGEAPNSCEPWINREILIQHLFSPAMWAIFPLQDILGMDGDVRRNDPLTEQINVPSNPNHYWRYRMHLNLEDLLEFEAFNEALAELVDKTGRNYSY
jgi:4-alpha-glucanotransferase